MAKAKKKSRAVRSIIVGHLEKIGAKVFDDYSSVITELIRGHQGIYALYKKDHLYYVGLASNLKSRINAHKRDRHRGKWTHFSLYIIRQEEHIREIESLVLRISYPKGNSVKGKLRQSRDLRPMLKRRLKDQWERRYKEIVGGKEKVTKAAVHRNIKKTDKPLKGYFAKRTPLYAHYKGQKYKAYAFRSGTIKYNGRLYESPSAAGSAARGGKSTNGWNFWKYKDKNNQLVKIKKLR
jgi:hypothetical protein